MTHWIQRWKNNQIGWHQARPNTKLVEFIGHLKLRQNDTVFVPLCGKSVDMIYLLERGYKVIGVELSALAIEQFFSDNKLDYKLRFEGDFKIYEGQKIRLYCGDYFQLNAAQLSEVVGVYDRAALIALPCALRKKYVAHLYAIISSGCRLLLLTLNYPQSQMKAPPFAVAENEVIALYQKGFEYQQLQCFNDLQNEAKFQRAKVDFIEKATYYLRKN